MPDCSSITMAEYTMALMLSLSRNLKKTIGGHFSRGGLSGFDLFGKTLGVIGTGSIGKHVVKLAHGFGMKILAYDLIEDKDLVKNYLVENFEL